METWKYIITRNFIILCLYPFSKISHLPPWLRARYSTEDITFWKVPVEFFDLSLYSKKVQRKQAFTPGNSAKLCDTPWKFQGPKPGPGHGNHTIFSCTPLEILLFLTDPWNFQMFFLQYPCLQPPSLFGFSGSLGQKPIHLLKIVSVNWRAAEGLSKKLPKKMPKNCQNLDILVTWKQFIKFSGWGISLALIIHLQQIYREYGRRGEAPP